MSYIFGKTPISILQDKRIKGHQNSLHVYIALQSFQGINLSCWPGQRAIAERAGIRQGNVSRCIKKLESLGWIVVNRENKKHSYIVYASLIQKTDDASESIQIETYKGVKYETSRGDRKENKNKKEKTKAPAVEKPKPMLVEKSEQKPDNEILTEIQPQVSDMNNETRLDIGYEQRNIDWNEIKKLRDEEAAKQAAWAEKDFLYGRYLGHKLTGGTEDQWIASLLNSKWTVEEFEDIKREWEGRKAV